MASRISAARTQLSQSLWLRRWQWRVVALQDAVRCPKRPRHDRHDPGACACSSSSARRRLSGLTRAGVRARPWGCDDRQPAAQAAGQRNGTQGGDDELVRPHSGLRAYQAARRPYGYRWEAPKEDPVPSAEQMHSWLALGILSLKQIKKFFNNKTHRNPPNRSDQRPSTTPIIERNGRRVRQRASPVLCFAASLLRCFARSLLLLLLRCLAACFARSLLLLLRCFAAVAPFRIFDRAVLCSTKSTGVAGMALKSSFANVVDEAGP
jgi:hypothetical protein